MMQLLREVLADPEVQRGLIHNPASFRFPSSPAVVAAAVHWPPHITVSRGTDGVLTVSGAMGNVMQVLSQTLNFTYSIITPEDGSWGAERPNGTWTGMVGQVIQNEADIALGPFGIKLSRSRVVDFTDSFYFDDRAILAKKGEPEIDPWGFLYPLTDSVWAALAGVLAVVWLTLWMVSRRPKVVTLLDWSIKLLLENMRVFLNQDVTKSLLDTIKARTVLGSWMVVAAVVFWSYTGTLTSLLAVRHIPLPIQTLRDLLDDSSVSVIMEPNTIVTDTISKMKTGELRELHELQFVGRVKYQHATTFPAALDTVVRRQRHAIISTSLSADLFMADLFILTGKCDFYKARQTFFTSTHCMIGQKGSPVVPAITHRIRSLIESGLYGYWLLSEIPAITTCRSSPPITLVRAPLSFANLWVRRTPRGLLMLPHDFVTQCFTERLVVATL
ncbi:probable glutamate receptor [Scylla paramamosain]|uniref:probable glutamate receptor n=1 Tax=Scylla paramamosain TaxID=85552 RepID=UPI003082D70F